MQLWTDVNCPRGSLVFSFSSLSDVKRNRCSLYTLLTGEGRCRNRSLGQGVCRDKKAMPQLFSKGLAVKHAILLTSYWPVRPPGLSVYPTLQGLYVEKTTSNSTFCSTTL